MGESTRSQKLHCSLSWNEEKGVYEAVCVELDEVTAEGETQELAIEGLKKRTEDYLAERPERVPFEKVDEDVPPEYVDPDLVVNRYIGYWISLA